MATLARQSARTAFKQFHVKVAPSSRRLSVQVKASEKAQYDRATGFVAEDNSGRANIFPTKQQAYLKSSTSDAAARQGLGGLQGGLLVGFVIGAVALATIFGAKTAPETLQTVASTVEVESLSAIAGRIQASL